MDWCIGCHLCHTPPYFYFKISAYYGCKGRAKYFFCNNMTICHAILSRYSKKSITFADKYTTCKQQYTYNLCE